jgi:hypothetical protein
VFDFNIHKLNVHKTVPVLSETQTFTRWSQMFDVGHTQHMNTVLFIQIYLFIYLLNISTSCRLKYETDMNKISRSNKIITVSQHVCCDILNSFRTETKVCVCRFVGLSCCSVFPYSIFIILHICIQAMLSPASHGRRVKRLWFFFFWYLNR